MRYTGARLIDPLKGHERLARQEFGVRTGRETDDDIRVAIEQWGNPAATERPRLTGSHRDGTASRDLARVLEWHGFAVDDTDDDPDPAPSPYENNAGILLRGAAPSVAAGGSTVVGAGATISLSDATDNSGRIVLVTGTGPSAAGVFATITFVRPKPNADYAVWVFPADPDACDRPAVSDFGGRTTTQFTVQNRVTFAAGTSYHYEWGVFERESL